MENEGLGLRKKNGGTSVQRTGGIAINCFKTPTAAKLI